MSEPENMSLSDRANEIAQLSSLVKAKSILDPAAKLVIDGTFRPNTWWLAADEVVLKPGAKIEFPASVVNVSRELYLVAEKITIEDPANPALITWEQIAPPAPPDRGQAASGAPGSGDGGNGGRGGDGAPGTSGTAGTDAPSFTLMIRTLAGGTVNLDFKGGPGGNGGMGQRGGDGGAGARGAGARQARTTGPFGVTIWQPWCESGPGQGGNGGDGGTGGMGGVGGRGGRGGSITIVSLPEGLPILTNAILRNVDGGMGGSPGATGAGGNGGAGGPEGELANFCNSAGRNGVPGHPGPGGAVGPQGEDGGAGRTFVASLTTQQFESLFGY